MAKKFSKFKTLLTEDGYRRIKEVRDNILHVKLPVSREEIACEIDHVIPSLDKQKGTSVRKEVQWFAE